MPRKKFAPLELLKAADVNQYLADQAVMTFATTAARDTAIPLADRKAGMVTFITSTGRLDVYMTVGAWSGWAPLPGSLVMRAHANAAQSIPNNLDTPMLYHQSTFDRGIFTTAVVGSGLTFTNSMPGQYEINAVHMFTTNINGIRSFMIYLNSVSLVGSSMAIGPSGTTAAVYPYSFTVSLVPGDSFTLGVYQNTGAALSTYYTGNYRPSMSIKYLGL
jgi:hypothetical protein